MRIKGKKLLKIWQEIREEKNFKMPERIHLGSSWKPPKRKERISKKKAIELLRGGFSPKEIVECFSGFTKRQLAAFKAHYVTMGKEISG